MDSKSSQYVEKYQEKLLRCQEPDEDELLLQLEDELDNDQVMSQYREQRVQELSKEFKQIQNSRIEVNSKYGNVRTISEERQVISETVQSKYTVIHFYKEDFATCKVMDAKLAKLSVRHLGTTFLRVDVIKSPFLVTKLNVKMLPCLVVYIDGVERDRVVGFERLGSLNGIDFQIENLESLLYNMGVLTRRATNFSSLRGKGALNAGNGNDSDDSDLDI